MAYTRQCAKLGLAIAISTTVLLYLFLPEKGDTIANAGFTNELISNFANVRTYLFDRTICLLEACFQLASPSNSQFFETVFQTCLSEKFFSWEEDQSTNKIHIVVVACGDRLEETLINIKSSLLFTKGKIVFHIFAEDELQPGFKEGIEIWPLRYRRNLEYHIYPITFPADGNEANWKKLFKPCASQRLFLPLVIGKDIDSVLYVDTDILFLTDVVEFWKFFHKFNSTQLSSLCIEHENKQAGWYNRFARHPYYGTTGLNSGVMLMNLTRMRNARYQNDLSPTKMTWEEMLLPLYQKYKYNITWGDQDLLNIVFHHNPEMLHIFTCEWNYRPDHCMYGQQCHIVNTAGVKIVHGNRGVYHNDKQPAFKAVYEALKFYKFQRNLTEYLYEPMRENLLKTENTYCGKEGQGILMGLHQSIEKKTIQTLERMKRV